jgi:hypothetical protein
MLRAFVSFALVAIVISTTGCGGAEKKSEAELKAEQEKSQQQADSEERVYQKQQKA